MKFSENALRYRWVILGLAWSSYISVYLARLSVGPLAPFLKEEMSLNNVQVGALASASALLYPFSQLVSGWLADRLGVRRLLSGGIIFAGIAIITIFFAPSYNLMLVVLALTSLGNGCVFPSATKAIVSWFPVRQRATAVGFNQTAINVGGIAGAALLPTIALTIGWKFGFLFIGIIALSIGIMDGLLYRDPPVERAAPPSKSSTRKALLILKNRDIWMLGLSCFCLAVVEFAGMHYLVLYLKESLLFNVVAAGGVLALAEASGGFGKPLSGIISDRVLGGRRKIALIAMGFLSAIACLIIGLGGAKLGWFLYPGIVLYGAAAIGWGGLMATMAGELGGKDTAGATVGTVGGILTLGIVVGPLIFGTIVDSTGGSFREAWLALAAFGFLSIVLATLIREKRPTD